MMLVGIDFDNLIENRYIADTLARVPNTSSASAYLVLKKCPEELKKKFRSINDFKLNFIGDDYPAFLFEEDFKDGEIRFDRYGKIRKRST